MGASIGLLIFIYFSAQRLFGNFALWIDLIIIVSIGLFVEIMTVFLFEPKEKS